MDGRHGLRPLARSLVPLAGESLAGYLLRLSCRLGISPLELARLTGCADGSSPAISRRLLLTLDVQRFAQATRLSAGEGRHSHPAAVRRPVENGLASAGRLRLPPASPFPA